MDWFTKPWVKGIITVCVFPGHDVMGTISVVKATKNEHECTTDWPAMNLIQRTCNTLLNTVESLRSQQEMLSISTTVERLHMHNLK